MNGREPYKSEEDVRLRMGFRITAGFVLQVFATLVAIAIGYATLQSDVKQALIQSQNNDIQIKQSVKDVDEIKIHLQMLDDNLKFFRDSYERDANKYIRDPKDRH